MTEQKPKVSIVILTKNTPLMLFKRCIHALYAQTIKEIEIIVFDMNDPASTFKEALKSDRSDPVYYGITFFEMTDDHEFVTSKNRMLQNFHGEYLTFISSQDIMPPQRLELAIEALESRRDRSVVCTNYILQAANVLDASNYQISSHGFAFLSQLIFHKDCFKLIGGFDENLVAHVDDELFLRLQRTGQIVDFPVEEAAIRVYADFYSRYSAVNGAIGCRQLYIKYKTYYDKNRKAKKALYLLTAEHYKDAGLFFRFIQFYTKAIFVKT